LRLRFSKLILERFEEKVEMKCLLIAMLLSCLSVLLAAPSIAQETGSVSQLAPEKDARPAPGNVLNSATFVMETGPTEGATFKWCMWVERFTTSEILYDSGEQQITLDEAQGHLATLQTTLTLPVGAYTVHARLSVVGGGVLDWQSNGYYVEVPE